MAVSGPQNELGYDLSVAKRLDRLMSRDSATRIGLTAVVLIVIWQAFDLWQALIILLAYVAATSLHGYIIDRLPVRVGPSAARLVQGTSIIVGMTWTGGLVYLWMQDPVEIRLVALTGLYLAMLNAMMMRREDDLLTVADTINIVIAILALTWVSYFICDAPREALSLFISGGMGFAYYCTGLYQLRKMRLELARAQSIEVERSRMETVGRLTGGVAHDFNNLLTVIHGNLELIREHSSVQEKDELARQALYATERASKVTAQLLTFVGRGSLEPAALDIYRSFDKAAEQIERQLPSRIGFARSSDPDFPVLHLDNGMFETVLVSLCMNSRNAMPDGGQVEISARRLGKDDALPDDLAPGNWVCIAVTDNGNGIPPELVNRVCEPYFTTRSQGGGLSLASAKGFAMQSGGTLTIDSTLGKGTVVSLYFPVPPTQA